MFGDFFGSSGGGGGFLDWLGTLFSGSGDAATTAGTAGTTAAQTGADLGTAAAQYGADLGGAGLDLLTNLGTSIVQNPLQALNLGMTGYGLAAPFFSGGSEPQQMGGFGSMNVPPNLQFQAGGADPAQLAGLKRQTMGDLQGRGLEGASPDFLANQMGLTLDELEQLMGRRRGMF